MACGSSNLPGGLAGHLGPCYSCGQMGHLRRECPLMECDIGWEVHPSGRMHSGKAPPLTMPIRLGQKTVMALLDSSVSLIRAHLVPPGLMTVQYTKVAGVCRQVCRWPVMRMALTYNNTIWRFLKWTTCLSRSCWGEMHPPSQHCCVQPCLVSPQPWMMMNNQGSAATTQRSRPLRRFHGILMTNSGRPKNPHPHYNPSKKTWPYPKDRW